MGLPTLSTHHKFLRLARLVGSRVLARGVLETLWEPCWTAGDPYVGTSDDIEALCEWKGERGALTKALLTAGANKGAGFIEPFAGKVRDHAEPHYQVHDFLAHCPDWVRRRRDREQGHGKRCDLCGGEYFSRDPRSRFCGPRCRQAAWRAGETVSPSRDGDVTVTAASPSEAEHEDGVTEKRRCVTEVQTTPSQHRNADPHLAGDVTQKRRRVTLVTAGTVRTCVGSTGEGSTGEGRTYADSPAASSAAAVTTDEVRGLEVDDNLAPPHATPRQPTDGDQLDGPVVLAPITSPVVLTFPVTGEKGPWWHLREDQVARWQSLYPDLDVLGEARQALAWIEAVPSRKKTFGGMAKCLVAWFNRSVDSPKARGLVITGSLKTAGNKAALEEFLRRRGHAVGQS